jgi:predicted enzyme related to lactoylglutathione lyase
MSTPKGQFVWHELVTTDAKASLAFYSGVVGWTSSAMKMGDGGTYHVLEAGKRGMGGVFEIPKESAGMQAGWVGYIGSPDVDADAARLKKAGGEVHGSPADIPNVGRFAKVSDPQGAGFILFKPQPPPGEVPARATGAGAVGWNELSTTDWKAALAFYSGLFGWKAGEAMDMGPAMGTYQLFSAGAEPIGGMMNRPAPAIAPHWLYYFNVDGINAALARVKAKGGALLNGPTEVPGPMWTVQCRDPQGAVFALLSTVR